MSIDTETARRVAHLARIAVPEEDLPALAPRRQRLGEGLRERIPRCLKFLFSIPIFLFFFDRPGKDIAKVSHKRQHD